MTEALSRHLGHLFPERIETLLRRVAKRVPCSDVDATKQQIELDTISEQALGALELRGKRPTPRTQRIRNQEHALHCSPRTLIRPRFSSAVVTRPITAACSTPASRNCCKHRSTSFGAIPASSPPQV